MKFIFLFVGIILGFIFSKVFSRTKKIHGHIDVDERTGLCRFKITSTELENPNTKKAIFEVNHNVEIPISRDEQSL